MANKLYLREESVEPWLVVGLGGTGSRIVEHLAHRLQEEPYWKGQLDSLVQFLCIDTNLEDQAHLGSPLHKAAIAQFNKPGLMKRQLTNPSQQVAHFINPDYEPREGGGSGAGQVRMESRFSFYHHSDNIAKTLREMVGRFDAPSSVRVRGAQGQPRHRVNVLMVFSAAGGTGSGAFLPFAYLVNDVIERQLGGLVARTCPVVLLSTLFQHTLSPGGLAKAHANCYAALKEIEHLQMLRYGKRGGTASAQEQFVYSKAAQDAIPTIANGPFYWVHLVERVLPERGTTMLDMERPIADSIFSTYFTPVFASLTGDFDNQDSVTKNQPSPSPHGNAGMGKSFANHYGTFGAAFLVLPDVALAIYCSLRATARLLRQQLTFATDAPALEARLASLRVDTTNKAFLAADEAVKTDLLNNSYRSTLEALAAHEEEEARRAGLPPTSRWTLLVERVTKGRLRELRPRVAAAQQADQAGLSGPAPGPGPSPSPGAAGAADPRREPTLVQRVREELHRERERTFVASVSAPAVSFQEENFDAAREILSRLERVYGDEKARMRLAETQLRLGARQGDVFRRLSDDERLSASDQRYLMIVVRSVIDQWVAEAESKVGALSTLAPAVDNAAYAEANRRRLDELAKSASWTMMEKLRRENSDFELAKQDFRQFTSQLVTTAVHGLHATLELAQLQELRTFMNERLDLYRRVSDGVAAQVEALESDARLLRDSWQPPKEIRKRRIPPGFVNRIEALASGDGNKASDRLWDEYFDLEIVRLLSERLDFGSVADLVGRQFMPVVEPRSGRVRPKSDQEVLAGIIEAVLEAAESKVRPHIEGGSEGDPEGLTLLEALIIEAELTKGLNAPANEAPSSVRTEYQRELDTYLRSRLTLVNLALHDLANFSQEDVNDLHVNQTVLLVDAGQTGSRLAEILKQKAPRTAVMKWGDTKVLGMVNASAAYPIFAFPAIQHSLEPSYRDAQAGRFQTAVSDLHIEWRWERMLPDLNPEGTYQAAEWCLEALARGLMFGLPKRSADGETVVWPLGAGAHPVKIGDSDSLTDWVYHLGLVWANHKDEKDRRAKLLVESIEEKRVSCADVKKAMREGLAKVTDLINGLSTKPGGLSDQEARELVVLRRLETVIKNVPNETWRPFEDRAAGGRTSGAGGTLLS